jgi:hypothetical protein
LWGTATFIYFLHYDVANQLSGADEYMFVPLETSDRAGEEARHFVWAHLAAKWLEGSLLWVWVVQLWLVTGTGKMRMMHTRPRLYRMNFSTDMQHTQWTTTVIINQSILQMQMCSNRGGDVLNL